MDKLPHLDEKNVCEFLSERIQGYFRSFDEIHAEDCETDTSDMKVYVKKSQLMGYIPTTELFRTGTVFRVRSVEADFELKADENTYIVSDAYCSAYRVEKNQFDSTYADSDETFVMKSEYPTAVVVKVHGDFFPCCTAEIPLLQQDTQFHICDLGNDIHDVLFGLNQPVHIRCNFIL